MIRVGERAKKSTIYVLVDRLIRLVVNLLVLTLWNVYFQHETYCLGAFFRLLGHVLSIGGVTLLGRVVFGESYLELNIRPRGPMATGILLSLQNQ